MSDGNGWLGAAGPRFDPNLGYRPTVSVVILSHRPTLLGEALASIWAQTLPQDEIEIIVKHGAVYHGHKLNDGICAARGRFIHPLPDDDRLPPDALETLVKTAESTGADFVYSDLWLFGGNDGDRRLELPDWSPTIPMQRCVPWWGALFRSEIFDEDLGIGMYDPEMQYQDWDFSRRLAKAGKVGVRIPQTLYHVREHEANGHKHMDHGWAFNTMRVKHLFTDPPREALAEFVYPPWYAGRPEILHDLLTVR